MSDLNTFYGIAEETNKTQTFLFWIALGAVLIAILAFSFAKLRRSRRKFQQDDESGREAYDPYEILGVNRGDSLDQLKRAYRKRMREYHPDKVAGLGAEFRELAERKAKEINNAFELLKAAHPKQSQ